MQGELKGSSVLPKYDVKFQTMSQSFAGHMFAVFRFKKKVRLKIC